MSVKIRMKRVCAKNEPVFRIVVADARSPRDGKFIEELGTYQPLMKGVNFTIDLDRAKYWGQPARMGAQGRILIPSHLRESAATRGGVAVIGYLNYLDVWSIDRFLEHMEKEPLTDDDLSTLSGLGI